MTEGVSMIIASPAFEDTPGRWVMSPKRHPVHAVPDKASFPGTVQLLRARFTMHQRPCPDRPKVAEVSILALENLLRRRISQRRVWSPITEVDSRQHQLSP